MADNRPPRFIARQLFGGAPRARMPHEDTGVVHSGGRGLAQNFLPPEPKESGDPAVNGNFERNPHTYFLHFPIAGGGLSERGQEQQAAQQRLQQYTQQITSATAQGATFQEAFRSLVRSNPSALNDLMAHPTALQSMENLTAALTTPGDRNIGTNAMGQVLKEDPQGNVRAVDIPGYQVKPDKPEKPTLLHTTEGFATLGPDGTATPVLGPNGERVMPAPTGKGPAANGFTDSDIGAGPQAPEKRLDGKPPIFNVVDSRFLRGIPSAIDALNTIQQNAPGVAGLGRSLISIAAGNYLGDNPQAQKVAQAFRQVNALSSDLAQRGAKVPSQNWEAMAGNPAMAPSALNSYAMQFKKVLRDTGQDTADQLTARAGERLPLPQAQELMKVGIFPNGYQTSRYTQHDPALTEQGAWWQARNFPQGLNEAQRGTLFDQVHSMGANAAARKQALGDADYNTILGLAKNRVQQATSTTAQTASTAAAKNVTEPVPAPTPAPVPQQAQPATPAGTTPQEGTPAAPQQPPAQQATPGAPQKPAAAPGQSSNNIDAVMQQRMTQAAQTVPLPTGASPVAPGNLIPGATTSQNVVPMAPSPPIPQQVTTATGAPPAPSVQPSLAQQTDSAQSQQALQATAQTIAQQQATAAQQQQNSEEGDNAALMGLQ